MKRITSTLSILLAGYAVAFSCSCIGPHLFINSIGHLIIEVEVLGIKTIPSGDILNEYDYTVTIMKVDSVAKGSYDRDTIFILNDKGFECFHSVPYKEEGKRYILTGDVLPAYEYYQNGLRKDTLQRQMMVLDLCKENILFLEDDRVLGNVTRNRIAEKNKRMNFIYRFNKKWYDKQANMPPKPNAYRNSLQKMSKLRFYRALAIRNRL